MPTGEAEIKVSAEAMVHKAIKDLAETVQNDYGIFIQTIIIDWLDISIKNGERSGLVDNTQIETTTKP